MKQQNTFDAFTAQVIQQRLVNIVEEMATILLRTSGSPVLTEAQDFSTAIFDMNGEHVAYSGYVTFHTGTSLVGVESVIKEYANDVQSGDAFIVNDPFTSGAAHQGDVGIVTPLFYKGTQVGWAFSNAHVLDVGGMSPGGWAPEAYDRYSEALNFPAMKIIKNNKIDQDWQRFIMNNVRMPIPVINDIKSMIAANNTAERRLSALIDKYGLETYKYYCAVNKDLSERVMRKRISNIPDGVYKTTEWVEYDGHGKDELWNLECKLIVSEDELTFDFSGSAKQGDGFVNAGPGIMLGIVYGAIGSILAYDIPINAGCWRPIHIELGESGTMTNPVIPAPVSCGHMEAGTKSWKAIFELMTKSCQLSKDEWVRNRVAAIGHVTWPGNSWVGTDQYGEFTSFPTFDCGSAGLGAQSTGDGLDIGATDFQQNNGIPDIETHEGLYPMLYFYRRINTNSGGAGFYRGGQGADMAWTPYNKEGLFGTIENACSELPARGMLGGYPGGTTHFYLSEKFDYEQFINENGRMPRFDEITNYEKLRNHIAGVNLPPNGVFRLSVGGGGGLGDPILRPIEWVEKDLKDRYITPEMALKAYGVVWDESIKQVDRPATEKLRFEIRKERLGSIPSKAVKEIKTFIVPLKITGKEFCCNHCENVLGSVSDNWKEKTIKYRSYLVPKLKEFEMDIRDRVERRVVMDEHICPQCGTMLAVDVMTENIMELHDYYVGKQPLAKMAVK